MHWRCRIHHCDQGFHLPWIENLWFESFWGLCRLHYSFSISWNHIIEVHCLVLVLPATKGLCSLGWWTHLQSSFLSVGIEIFAWSKTFLLPSKKVAITISPQTPEMKCYLQAYGTLYHFHMITTKFFAAIKCILCLISLDHPYVLKIILHRHNPI